MQAGALGVVFLNTAPLQQEPWPLMSAPQAGGGDDVTIPAVILHAADQPHTTAAAMVR